MNPFEGLAKFALGLIEQKTLQNWLKLLFEMIASGILTFMLTCGVFLIGSKLWAIYFPDFNTGIAVVPEGDWALSIGLGLVTSAMMVIAVFRRSPLSKGLMLVLPSWEAAAEIAANIQEIERNQEKK
jgi:hypothetical protein